MKRDRREDSSVVLIDFSQRALSRGVTIVRGLHYDVVSVNDCILWPNPGLSIGTVQLVVAVHLGTPFDIEWQTTDDDIRHRRRIVEGNIHITDANRPFYQQWSDRPHILAIALDKQFVEQTATQAFDLDRFELRTRIGITDPTIAGIAALWDNELREAGAGGRLYAESLGAALTIHLCRSYGDHSVRLRPISGGLSPRHLKLVVDFIEENLSASISLDDLSRLVGLSAHHFGEAFKNSVGVPPHRYLIERRVLRAKELLLGTRRTISSIALTVGFANHSHLTANFRKLLGVTPSRFRNEALNHSVTVEHEASIDRN